ASGIEIGEQARVDRMPVEQGTGSGGGHRHVTADNAGADPHIANRDTIGTWEEFDLIAV
ncbi:MAG: hypothetical protein QOF98_1305, partial [Streptomyces sp.]|nr:hypothetical protein [Streptomyces sp.]